MISNKNKYTTNCKKYIFEFITQKNEKEKKTTTSKTDL